MKEYLKKCRVTIAVLVVCLITSDIALAQNQFIKYKKHLIPISAGMDPSGKLKVCGTKLCDQNGQQVFLKGSSWVNFFDEGGDRNSSFGIPESDIRQYLNWMEGLGLNYVLFKASLFSIKDDLNGIRTYSVDDDYELDDINKLHRMIRYAESRGIYVQICLFDTWSRASGTQTFITNKSLHPINIWSSSSSQKSKAENYMKYMVNEFKDYPNVFFEFGNELDHGPSHSTNEINTAKANMSDLLVEYYNIFGSVQDALPISVSETKLWNTGSSASNRNVNLLAQHNLAPKNPTSHGNRPIIYNEILKSDGFTASPNQPFSVPSSGVLADHFNIEKSQHVSDYQQINQQIKNGGHAGTICGATLLEIDKIISNGQVIADPDIVSVYSHCGGL